MSFTFLLYVLVAKNRFQIEYLFLRVETLIKRSTNYGDYTFLYSCHCIIFHSTMNWQLGAPDRGQIMIFQDLYEQVKNKFINLSGIHIMNIYVCVSKNMHNHIFILAYM